MLNCRSVRPAEGAFAAMLIGYARVFALDQNQNLQTTALKPAGAECLYAETVPLRGSCSIWSPGSIPGVRANVFATLDGLAASRLSSRTRRTCGRQECR